MIAEKIKLISYRCSDYQTQALDDIFWLKDNENASWRTSIFDRNEKYLRFHCVKYI